MLQSHTLNKPIKYLISVLNALRSTSQQWLINLLWILLVPFPTGISSRAAWGQVIVRENTMKPLVLIFVYFYQNTAATNICLEVCNSSLVEQMSLVGYGKPSYVTSLVVAQAYIWWFQDASDCLQLWICMHFDDYGLDEFFITYDYMLFDMVSSDYDKNKKILFHMMPCRIFCW